MHRKNIYDVFILNRIELEVTVRIDAPGSLKLIGPPKR